MVILSAEEEMTVATELQFRCHCFSIALIMVNLEEDQLKFSSKIDLLLF